MSPKERTNNIARATAWNKAHPERRREIKRRSYQANRERAARAQSIWYQNNREKMLKVNSDWKKNHPELVIEFAARRRAVKKHVTSEKIKACQLKALLVAQAGRCAYCGIALDGKKHLDHRIPLSRGGEHSLKNLAWACPGCNLSKGKRLPSEWTPRITTC